MKILDIAEFSKKMFKYNLWPSGAEFSEGHCENRETGLRKQWAAVPSESVLQVLGSASLVSSDSQALTASTPGGMRTTVFSFPAV